MMNLFPFLMDVVKYSLAGLGVVWVAFYLIKPYLDRDEKIQLLEFRKTLSNQTMPLRLQAYERLVLFIERINPANMLVRLNATTYTALELQSLIVEDIRSEYQHNVTQQIYVSSRAWAAVRSVRDDTLNIVGNAVKSLPADASGLELAKTILSYLSRLEDNPYDIAAGRLRKDLEDLF
jgi:hypothetical protein